MNIMYLKNIKSQNTKPVNTNTKIHWKSTWYRVSIGVNQSDDYCVHVCMSTIRLPED